MEDPNLVQLQNAQTAAHLNHFLAVFNEQLLNNFDPFKYKTSVVFHTVLRKLRQIYFIAKLNEENNNNNNNDNNDCSASLFLGHSSEANMLETAILGVLGPFIQCFLSSEDNEAFCVTDDVVSCIIDFAPAAVQLRCNEGDAAVQVLTTIEMITAFPAGAALFTTERGIDFLVGLLQHVTSQQWGSSSPISSISNVLTENDEAEKLLNEKMKRNGTVVGDVLIAALALVDVDHSHAETALRLIFTYFIRNENKPTPSQVEKLYRAIFQHLLEDSCWSHSFGTCAAVVMNEFGRASLCAFLGCQPDQIVRVLSQHVFETRSATVQQRWSVGPVFDHLPHFSALASFLLDITIWDQHDDSMEGRMFSANETIRLLTCDMDPTTWPSTTPRNVLLGSTSMRVCTMHIMFSIHDKSVARMVTFCATATVAHELSMALRMLPPSLPTDQFQRLHNHIQEVMEEICLRASDLLPVQFAAYELFSSHVRDGLTPDALERELLQTETPDEFLSYLEGAEELFSDRFIDSGNSSWFRKQQTVKIITEKCGHFVAMLEEDENENNSNRHVVRDKHGYLPTELNQFICRFASFWGNHTSALRFHFEALLDVFFLSLLPRSTGQATIFVLGLMPQIYDCMAEREVHFPRLSDSRALFAVFETAKDEQLGSAEFFEFSNTLKDDLLQLFNEVRKWPIFVI